MAKPLWVQVQGPNGPTTVQLTAAWQTAVKADCPVNDGLLVTVVKRAAGNVLRCYDTVDGPFSLQVRAKARQMLRDLREIAET